jgi:1-deoxy-D-xylulose-5-phosphate synthase
MLEKIDRPNAIKKLPIEDLPELAGEIRKVLIDTVSRTGGHLASNLGSVELTIALHYVYTLPKDKIIWDVGHQSYTHKILTGRRGAFSTLRREGGISGFPRRSESSCDCWDSGHSSNSISAGLGYVYARDLNQEDYHVVSVIGDGALTGGMAYEALNNAAQLKTNYVIVLNDNNMSISRNVGGMHNYLAALRTSPKYTDWKDSIKTKLGSLPDGDKVVNSIRRTKNSIKELVLPGMFFEDIGITYMGPVDGHNIRAMIDAFRAAKRMKGPILVHVVTQKGRGYLPATRHPERFHGTCAFDIDTGLPVNNGVTTYTDVFSTVMVKMGERNPKVCAITAAMDEGTGLKRFANKYPERFFDTGIAEEHAVTFSAGLALGGMVPVTAIYSAFLQRAFDQILDDVCLQNLHVVFCIDRAGFVGADGATHNGCFDLSYLSMMPNMTVMAPKNKWELSDMIKFAIDAEGPVAIRYPKGEAWEGLEDHREPIAKGRAEVIEKGSGVALLAVGSMVRTACETAELLKKEGIHPTIVNMRFVKPFDKELLRELSASHDTFVTIEENVRSGGFGERVQDFAESEELPVHVNICAIPDEFIHHAAIGAQRKKAGLDAETIAQKILKSRKET